ncbi:DUF1656 domain-containing protein [Phytohalomonas tamaricis]|uniref:DUF1656 domain-containing protein n=1 Tax=Phytohalomonas tamaricis TaxID=2081032 RepID=UPI000D0B53AB|nr:DUF1656 domain-containing protein [Phytohalomonas tamaricis]
MIGDIDVGSVYLPTLLMLMLLTYLFYLPLQVLLTRIHFYRLVWHRALFNVALYALLLGLVDALYRHWMP